MRSGSAGVSAAVFQLIAGERERDGGISETVFVNDGKSGRYLGAQHFAGMTPEDAVRKAETEFDSPYGR